MSLADPTGCTLAALLREQTLRQPDAPAILAPGRSSLDYRGLWQQVVDIAAALQSLGTTASSRVAVLLPNGPEMATAFIGTAACSVCAPLNPACREAEIRFHLQDLRAEVVIVRNAERGPVVGVAKELGLAVL